MSNRSDSRDRMIKATALLLQTKGYVGTGLNDIVKESGAPKGSIYHHFPQGKEQLAIEAVNWTKENVTLFIKERLALYEDPSEAIKQFVINSADRFEGDSYLTGVPITALILETSSSSEGLRNACQAVFEAWIEVFAAKLLANGYKEEKAYSLGMTINVMIQGAFVTSLARKDAEALRAIADVIPLLLEE